MGPLAGASLASFYCQYIDTPYENTGKWNELLEHRIPLRSFSTPTAATPLGKVKVEEPVNEKMRSPASPMGAPAIPLAGASGRAGRVSLRALGKRVAADQLFMCVAVFSLT